MSNECCTNCKHFHRLKYNFKVGEGFQESFACDALLHLPDSDSKAWIQEVKPEDRCEFWEISDEI